MKIILAIGNTQVEDALITSLPQKCRVVGIAPYREAVLTKLEEAPSTDVVLIRDNLKGSLSILKLIHQIRSNYPHCRIILMTKQREAGDAFLSEVVSFGIWDIIVGSKSSVSIMVDYILNPRTFKDVERYQIRKMISEKDESTPSQNSIPKQVDDPHSHSTNPSLVGMPTEASPQIATSQSNASTESSIDEDTSFELNFTFDETEQPANLVFDENNPSTNFVFDETNGDDQDVVFQLDDNPFASTDSSLPPIQETPDKGTPSKRRRSSFPEAKMPTTPQPPVVPIPVPIPTPVGKERQKEVSSIHANPEQSTAKKPMPKLFSNDDVKDIKKTKPSKRKAFQTEIKNSPVVMSLIGIRGGVGTTQTALNLAITLANKKNRVLYVELNDSGLPFTYLYQLGNLSNGLETALEMAASPGLQDVSSCVTRMKELKRSTDKTLASVASKYPDSLDFIAFSQFFNREANQNYHPESLKELLMGLLLSEGYQYIILDVNLRSDQRLIEQALSSSRYILPVITQNVLTIGQAIDYLTTIHSNMFDLSQKVYFLINRYNSDLLKDRSILKWANNELPFKVQNIWSIPIESKAYQVADDKNYPVLVSGAPRALSQAFETLHNYLKTM